MPIFKGFFAHLLEACTVGLDGALLPFFTSVWMFPVALLMTLQVYRKGGSEIVRTLGKSIIVLQLYYCKTFGATETNSSKVAFTTSCFYLFLDEAILNPLMKNCAEQPQENKHDDVAGSRELRGRRGSFRNLQDNVSYLSEALIPNTSDVEWDEEAADKERQDKAWNVYMDFRKPIHKAFVVFFAQFGLFMYYLFELNGESDDDDSPGRDAHFLKNVSMVKWCFAVALIMVAGDEEVGPRFGLVFWRDKRKSVFNSSWRTNWTELTENEERDKSCWCPMPPRVHILLRMVWDCLINAVARAVICGTAPIMLCVEGPLDFVKDATAVFFIIKLDDIEDTAYLKDADTWNPLSLESHYEVTVANDRSYKINGLRKLLELPSVQEVKAKWMGSDEQQNLVREMEDDRRKNSNVDSAAPTPTVQSVSPTLAIGVSFVEPAS